MSAGTLPKSSFSLPVSPFLAGICTIICRARPAVFTMTAPRAIGTPCAASRHRRLFKASCLSHRPKNTHSVAWRFWVRVKGFLAQHADSPKLCFPGKGTGKKAPYPHGCDRARLWEWWDAQRGPERGSSILTSAHSSTGTWMWTATTQHTKPKQWSCIWNVPSPE